MKITKTISIIAAFLATAATTALAGDFTLPLTVSSGLVKTSAVAGITSSATNGFDKGMDVPNPFTEESLNAFFSHPEWNIISAGSSVTTFYRDIRGSLPQVFTLTVATTLSPVNVSWDREAIPGNVSVSLSCDGQIVDMKSISSLTFLPIATTTQINISMEPGDVTPPAAPANLAYEIKGASIYLTWSANIEADLAGYKLHQMDEQGTITRSLDLKDVTNYNLITLVNDMPYRISVSAYDKSGNESALSSVLTAVKLTPPPVTEIAADGDIDGDGNVSIADAVKVLRMSLNLDAANSTAVSHGDLDGDGNLTIRDALKILRKVVGLL